MRPATAGATTPSTNAIIVFAREGTPCDHGGFVRILEKDGAYVGDIAPAARFAIAVAPGEHVFVGWDMWFQEQPDRVSYSSTTALHASLAPGRTYYVSVRLGDIEEHRRCARSSVVDLVPVGARHSSGEDVASLVAATEPQEPQEACGRQVLLDQPAVVARRILQGERTWERYSPQKRADRTITPDDGI